MHNGLDNSDPRRNLHRPGNQRLSAGGILSASNRFCPALRAISEKQPDRLEFAWRGLWLSCVYGSARLQAGLFRQIGTSSDAAAFAQLEFDARHPPMQRVRQNGS
jgi:hypothetical protein